MDELVDEAIAQEDMKPAAGCSTNENNKSSTDDKSSTNVKATAAVEHPN
jgi:hypothetical protein